MFHMDEGTSANSELNGEDNEAGFSGTRSGAHGYSKTGSGHRFVSHSIYNKHCIVVTRMFQLC